LENSRGPAKFWTKYFGGLTSWQKLAILSETLFWSWQALQMLFGPGSTGKESWQQTVASGHQC